MGIPIRMSFVDGPPVRLDLLLLVGQNGIED